MPDWEEMILANQELEEIYEDNYCYGCRYYGINPQGCDLYCDREHIDGMD